MHIKHLDTANYVLAGDGSILAELLHPGRESDISLQCSIAYCSIAPGQRTHRHRLLHSTEIYCIVSGSAVITIEDETAEISTGTIVHIPPGAWQSVANFNTEPLLFYCIVDPAWRAEDEEILELE